MAFLLTGPERFNVVRGVQKAQVVGCTFWSLRGLAVVALCVAVNPAARIVTVTGV